jgi:hypothetical protein
MALHERSESRTALRNGHRTRVLSTPAGDLELRTPKLRTGSFFPSLLERRRRVDQALFAVVMEAHLHGVSTRKVDDLAKALGADSGISKSEVSARIPAVSALCAACANAPALAYRSSGFLAMPRAMTRRAPRDLPHAARRRRVMVQMSLKVEAQIERTSMSRGSRGSPFVGHTAHVNTVVTAQPRAAFDYIDRYGP